MSIGYSFFLRLSKWDKILVKKNNIVLLISLTAA
jgi:hypothetical protein